MYFNIIASGSKGNATLVIKNDTAILIDMGIPLIRLKEELKEVGKNLDQIDAIIFTHDHTDHISGIKFLPQNKMYALEGTLPGKTVNVIELYKTFKVKDFSITPVKISHDAINPCGYILECENEKMVYITDTGYILDETYPLLKNPDYLILESNHDIRMLLNTDRPMELKQRILGDHGHLCNEESALAAAMIIGPKTREVVLAHLSEEANTPELALEAYEKILQHFHIDTTNVKIRSARQWTSLKGGHNEN